MRDPKRLTKCARMAAAKSTLFSFLSLSFFLFSSGVVEASVSSDAATTIEMHGSGTTNPSKYFWKAMDILEERAGKPVRMTYRAVGSGTGQTEFIGDVSDFGSADIPLSSSQHSGFGWYCRASAVSARRGEFLSQRRRGRLWASRATELDGCALAKIFLRQITTWDDATIVAENPNLSVPAGQPITIIHRSDGSSSTYGITSYLSVACPDVWTGRSKNADLFPVDATYALPRQGSGNVANAIAENQYSIGYIDAGHGHELGFQEISLTNKIGQQLV